MIARWTVGPGRALLLDGREVLTIDRVRRIDASRGLDPHAANVLTREIARLLNASDADPHALAKADLARPDGDS